MKLKELKSGLSAAVEKYNGKQVGVGEIRIDLMARDCFNAIVDFEKQIAVLKSERDVAVRALEMAVEWVGRFDCPASAECKINNPVDNCEECTGFPTNECWNRYFIQQAKEEQK